MRILFVHERFGAFGGAEANILATAAELKQRGHAVAILHGPDTGKAQADWHHTFPSRFAFAAARPTGSVRTALEAFAADVIYLHKLSDLDALEQLLSSQIPVVRMVHDHALYCMRSYKYNYFTRRVCTRALSPYCLFPCGACVSRGRGSFPLRWVSYREKLRELNLNRSCSRLIVATPFMKAELLRNRFDGGKIEIHPPVPPAGDPAWRSSFSEGNYIAYTGQLIRGKGVDVLLEALSLVRPSFTCFVFGEGDHRGSCERLCRKLGLTGRVRFKGYVPPADLALFYRECSLLAVSSVWPEPFGAVGLEAMQFGLPVVAFDVGGIRSWLHNGVNGFLVPWMDRTAFAARVEQLLQDKTLARSLGERGRRLAADSYDFSDYIGNLERLFEQVAETPALAACA